MSTKEESPAVDCPRIRRDLEIVPVRSQGKLLFLVRDSLGLVKEQVGVTHDLLAFMSLLDGRRTRADIQLALQERQKGEPVPQSEINKILHQLESIMLLDNEEYRAAKNRLIDGYRSQPVRPCLLAGHSFPAKAEELNAYVDRLLVDDARPAALPGRVTAIVVPHLDLRVSELAYSQAWKVVRAQRPERVIILGTGHQMDKGLFCLTDKDFETPLGRVATDKDAVRRLREVARDGLLAPDDLPHWKEHSIEIQLIFMQRLFGESVRMVPILCGSLGEHLARHRRLADVPGMKAWLEVLRDLAGGASSLTVVSVDMAHIGPKFGHDRSAIELSGEAKREDGALLKAVGDGDARGFWKRLAGVTDRYNVCGASALACLLEMFPNVKGSLLDYEMWHEFATQSAVSYAALWFGRPSAEGSKRRRAKHPNRHEA